MDPIDILGSILGQKSSGGGMGAEILKEIFKGATQGGGQGRLAPAPKSRAPAPREVTESDIDRQARELEDLLNVANDRSARRGQSPPTPAPQTPPPRQAPQPQAIPAPQSREVGRGSGAPASRRPEPSDEFERQNEQALTLVRAMVNAAKSDGQISQTEQQAILSRLDNPPPETIQFLRDEFNKPLDVREFAWSVPVGMEQQVYTMSLIAIDLDTNREETYLQELAHGLRIPQEVCEQIKERVSGSSLSYAGAR